MRLSLPRARPEVAAPLRGTIAEAAQARTTLPRVLPSWNAPSAPPALEGAVRAACMVYLICR